MNFFEQILVGLDAKMEEPQAFGWFHLMCWGLVIIITTLLCLYAVKHRNDQEKLVRFTRIVVLTYSILGIILEIYKQLNFSFNSTSGEWSYQWYAFPFQFCSTPMYVGLIAGCCKEGGFQKFLYSYLATFALFAGLSVMFYPGDVFTRTIGINIQTMVCHGGMVVMGIYLWFSKQVKFEFKTILKALSVFCVLVTVALIMNVIFNSTGNTATFNMFFISPYLPCTLPILNMVYKAVPYPIFLIIYIIGFTLAAFIMLLVAIGINRLVKLKIRDKGCYGLEDDKTMKKIFVAIE